MDGQGEKVSEPWRLPDGKPLPSREEKEEGKEGQEEVKMTKPGESVMMQHSILLYFFTNLSNCRPKGQASWGI